MEYFSTTYLGARSKFLYYAKHICEIYKGYTECDSIHIENNEMNKRIYGAEKEDLYVDTFYIGSAEPDKLLIYTSGIGGIDGYIGSAIQCYILDNIYKLIKFADMNNKNILFIHAFNPYGMSHYRRWNENNIDLNNNFRNSEDFILNTSPIYEEMSDLLNPTKEPFSWRALFYMKYIEMIFKYNKLELKEELIKGQNRYLNGLFNYGTELQFIPKIILSKLEKFKNVSHVINIQITIDTDITFGEDMIEYDKYNNHSFNDCIKYVFNNKKINSIVQKFGTFDSGTFLFALCKENYYHHYKKIDNDHYSRKDLYNIYCPNNIKFKQNILSKALYTFNETSNLLFIETKL